MPGNLLTLPKQVPINLGTTVPGAKLYSYQTGTSTPQDLYTDLALSVAHSNPLEADANGVFPVAYYDPSLPAYRLRLTDSSDTLIYQVDGIPSGSKASADEFTVSGAAPYIDLVETGVTANEGGWRIRVNSEELSIALMNDAKSVFTNILRIYNRSGTSSADVELSANLLATGQIEFDALTTFDGPVAGVPSITSGTFTPSWSGFSAAPTGDIGWQKITGPVGSIVMLYFGVNAGSGTSNGTGMSLTSLPSTIRPTTDSGARYPCLVVDNGARVAGSFGFGTPAGTLNFAVGTNYAGFTGSGTKGFPPLSILMYGV